MKAEPFLKWVGGKRQLLPQILPRIPENINTYFEPFIGGGAVFFALANEKRFKTAVISDKNPELINLYTVVRDDVENLIGSIDVLAAGHCKDQYYSVRGHVPGDRVAQAARTLYLNKTCFNGLYRVNKSGVFNVPIGDYKNPRICDPDGLRAASAALFGVHICCCDFEFHTVNMRSGDFVYFDPPYLPASDTANFRGYQPGGFTIGDTENLRDLCIEIPRWGAGFLLSNSDTPDTRKIFRGMKIDEVSARRNVNSNGAKRGSVGEILVSGP